MPWANWAHLWPKSFGRTQFGLLLSLRREHRSYRIDLGAVL